MEDRNFLNARSMATPGGCSGVVVLIADGLASSFGAPAIWVALGASSLLGISVSMKEKMPLWERLIFVVINSLIIFSLSVGVNQTTVGAVQANHATHGQYEETPCAERDCEDRGARMCDTPVSERDITKLRQHLSRVSRDLENPRAIDSLHATGLKLQEMERAIEAFESTEMKELERVEVTDSRRVQNKPFFHDWFE